MNLIREKIKNYIEERKPNIWSSLVLSFCFGIIFAPFSLGLYYFLIWLILYEIFLYIYYKSFDYGERIAILVISLLGFLIGRLLIARSYYHNN